MALAEANTYSFNLILITYVNFQLVYYTLIIIVNIFIFYQPIDHLAIICLFI